LPLGLTLSGRLVDEAGAPVLGAGGNIEDPTQDVQFSCALGFGSSDTDGTFQVNLPAGTYDLTFCQADECHTVLRGQTVDTALDLGDVRFADAP